MLTNVIRNYYTGKYGNFKLREIQEKSIKCLKETLDNVCVCASTASGKTLIAMEYISHYFSKFKYKSKIAMITPFNELCRQTEYLLKRLFGKKNIGNMYGEDSYDNITNKSIVIFTPEQFYNRIIITHQIEYHLVVFDEFHVMKDKTRGKCAEGIVFLLSITRSVRSLLLSGSVTSDLKSYIQMIGYEIVESKIDRLIDFKTYQDENVLDYIKEDSLEKRVIIFCSDVNKCNIIHEMIKESYIHNARMEENERERNITEFREKKGIMVCTSTLQAGIDIPDVGYVYIVGLKIGNNIIRKESIIQMIGRSNRDGDTIQCRIFDLKKENITLVTKWLNGFRDDEDRPNWVNKDLIILCMQLKYDNILLSCRYIYSQWQGCLNMTEFTNMFKNGRIKNICMCAHSAQCDIDVCMTFMDNMINMRNTKWLMHFITVINDEMHDNNIEKKINLDIYRDFLQTTCLFHYLLFEIDIDQSYTQVLKHPHYKDFMRKLYYSARKVKRFLETMRYAHLASITHQCIISLGTLLGRYQRELKNINAFSRKKKLINKLTEEDIITVEDLIYADANKIKCLVSDINCVDATKNKYMSLIYEFTALGY
jgi:superfamily II DNA or RNA helicase